MHSILAARTDFSIGESILTVDQLVEEAKKVGATAVAMTDTMTITGMTDFTSKAKKAGIKPIIGVRLRLTDDPTWRQDKGEKKKDMPPTYFVTAYVLSEAGMAAIFRLLTLANSAERFYYVSKLGFEDLNKELAALGENDLALLLGDTESVLRHPELSKVLGGLVTANGNLPYYVPLVPIDTPYFVRMNQIALEVLDAGFNRTWLSPLVVRPAFYEAGGADAHEILGAIANNNKVSDGWHRSMFNRDFHITSLGELAVEARKAAERLTQRGLSGTGRLLAEGMANTDKLVDAVTYEWKKAPVSLPVMAPDEFAAVKAACAVGWKTRFSAPVFGHQPSPDELRDVYMPRLKYELEVLKKLNFSGYFLLVQDVVQYAKSNGILVGPGRGSVGGSLVAYLMGITECDPLRFDLLFERFINPDRIDLPDADLDFMSKRRHEVVDYLIAKYGEKRVAGVSNFAALQAAGSMRDVGRVLELPERDYSCSKFVPKVHGQPVKLPVAAEEVADIKALSEKYPEAWTVMSRLEGTMRTLGQHAAGIVVGGVDLVERAVIEKRAESSAVVNWDKRIVEDMGLVKMDLLGLQTLDIIGLALDYIWERRGKRIDLMRIPLDDKAVLDNFAQGNTTGVFQFESGGMRKLLKNIAHDGTITFDDITAANALYRPGPMESGMMDSYWKRKSGAERVDYDHPLLEPVLKSTFGVMTYQEQVMQVSRVIAGYSAPAADKLRKIMGKKLPEEMAKERGKFVEGCVATVGCTEEWAGALFDKIEGFAGYGFNKSHAVEYCLISYQAMWLKVYYGVEFYAAALSLMDQDKLPELIKDAGTFGIKVAMPDINISTGRFEIANDTTLVIPFKAIKGISDITTNAILEVRKDGPFTSRADFDARLTAKKLGGKCNKNHKESLDKVGAFARIEPGTQAADNPARLPDQIELLPGLIDAAMPIDRVMEIDDDAATALSKIVEDYTAEYGPTAPAEQRDGIMVKPLVGTEARVMIILDAASRDEEQEGFFGWSRSLEPVILGMAEAGLNREDFYWTGLIKRPKKGKQVSAEEIKKYAPYLQREIDAIKPTIIVLMGTTTVKTFLPDYKGKASDDAGKIVYSKPLDANFVIGFNPGELYYAPEKQENMNAVFNAVKGLL